MFTSYELLKYLTDNSVISYYRGQFKALQAAKQDAIDERNRLQCEVHQKTEDYDKAGLKLFELSFIIGMSIKIHDSWLLRIVMFMTY